MLHMYAERLLTSSYTLAVALCAIHAVGVYGQSGASAHGVIDAWRKRETEAVSVRMTCDGLRTISKAFIDAGEENTGVPEKGVAFPTAIKLAFYQDCMKYQNIGSIWNLDDQKLLPSHDICSFDGTEARSLSPAIPGVPRIPKGDVFREKYNPEVNNVLTLPPRLLYRPFHPKMGVFGQDMRLVADSVNLRGESCLLLEEPSKQYKGCIQRVWVDPERDFLIHRYSLNRSGSAQLQIDFSYRKDGEHWRPERWTVLLFLTATEIAESFDGKLTEFVWNPEMSEDDFRIAFPDGTYVIDHNLNPDPGGTNSYIVQQGGKKRPLLAVEEGARYAELLRTAPGHANVRGSESSGLWWVWCLGVVGVALALLSWRTARIGVRGLFLRRT